MLECSKHLLYLLYLLFTLELNLGVMYKQDRSVWRKTRRHKSTQCSRRAGGGLEWCGDLEGRPCKSLSHCAYIYQFFPSFFPLLPSLPLPFCLSSLARFLPSPFIGPSLHSFLVLPSHWCVNFKNRQDQDEQELRFHQDLSPDSHRPLPSFSNTWV